MKWALRPVKANSALQLGVQSGRAPGVIKSQENATWQASK